MTNKKDDFIYIRFIPSFKLLLPDDFKIFGKIKLHLVISNFIYYVF